MIYVEMAGVVYIYIVKKKKQQQSFSTPVFKPCWEKKYVAMICKKERKKKKKRENVFSLIQCLTRSFVYHYCFI
jgi:hypothetical protein